MATPARALAALLCAAALACVAAAPAGATPTLGWSAIKVDGAALTGVSCASQTLCVAVDREGDALIATNPGSDAAASWSQREIDGKTALTGISCASTALCVAVDKEGDALISTNPTAGAGSGWSHVEIDGKTALTGISCASTTLCVAVDREGDALISTNPTAGAGSGWSHVEIDGKTALTGISCASTALCVAVDDAGRALASREPTGSFTWHPSPIDLNPDLTAVSCAPAPAGVCVAVDAERDVLASGDPIAEAPTWSWTPAFALAPGSPTAVSCAAAGLCVSVDSGGGAYAGDGPTATPPSWTFAGIDPGTSLSGVSCVSEGLCAAVDAAGRVLVARVPMPTVATGTPSALGETSATLSGAVDPQDATLTSCHFEYGPSTAYGQSAECANGVGIAGGAAQAVSATLSDLTAGAVYHYRLVAGSASGTAVSADATFKTTAPPVVEPHPSISGIPALGQRLTCKSGVSASSTSASATLSYAWLHDTQAVAGANSSTYTVTSADVSHHLQCRVTATNAGGSASATSSFVTIPAGGLGAISETHVGTLRVTGATVSVPLTCSAQAAGSCTIALRLTVVETLHGSRVVAVAAARVRHATVTVAASTVHLKPSQRLTVNLTLNATGRRLLAHLHQMQVKLVVSGTVVGALSATLKSATLTVGGAGRASSHRATTHPRR
jgi:hypothetical protein